MHTHFQQRHNKVLSALSTKPNDLDSQERFTSVTKFSSYCDIAFKSATIYRTCFRSAVPVHGVGVALEVQCVVHDR